MTTKAAAVQAWLESFGMPAYAEGSVPVSAKPPYMVYQPVDGALFEASTMAVSMWMRTTSEARANAKASEVSRALSGGGDVLACEGGAVWLRRGSPFCQPADAGERGVKRRLINIEIEFMTLF